MRENRDTPNRSPRIDEYARAAGHDVGLEWCGNFIAFNYREAGMRYGSYGTTQMSNSIRATYFFNYRLYTNLDRAARRAGDATAAQHAAQGSTRQFWTLPDSYGAGYLRSHRGSFATDFRVEDHIRQPSELPLRPGDIVMWRLVLASGRVSYHIGMVRSYDPATGNLETIEGNRGGRVATGHYNVNDASFRERLYGFGRPALGDFPSQSS